MSRTMPTLIQQTAAWWLMLTLLVLSHWADGATLQGKNSQPGTMEEILTSQPALIAAVTSLAVIIVLVIALLGCLDICRKREGFQNSAHALALVEHMDFANEEVFSPEIIETQPSGQFTMLPPIENTPDSYSTGPVVFEPLPDIATAHQVETPSNNRMMLRPRVGLVGPSGADYGGGGDAPPDPIRQKLQLQKIVTNSQLQLPRNQLHFVKELGSGWFGQVLQGEGNNILPGHRKTKVVIQRLREDADYLDQLCFLQEATPFREVTHSNVIRVLGHCTEVSPFLLVLELCPFGDVKTYLRSHKVAVESFNEKGLLLKFACDMAAGLIELHTHNFVHHDFATRNCLLGSDLTVKVGDYGLGESTYPEDYYKDSHGDGVPIRWMAPECLAFTSDHKLQVKQFTMEANIWSYGVALWEVLQFGQLPYSDLTDENVLRLVVREKSIKLPKPDMPISFLGRIFQLIQLCCSEPDQRPSLRQVRILLLHLLASKGSSQSSLFDQKWNQLMPKKPAQVEHAGESAPASATVPNFNRTPAAGASFDTPVPAPAQRPETQSQPLTRQDVPRTLSFDEEMAQFDKERAKKESTPVNELDLQAELAAVGNMPSPVKPVADGGDTRVVPGGPDDSLEDLDVGKAIPYSEPTSPAGDRDPLSEFATSTPNKVRDKADQSETPSNTTSQSETTGNQTESGNSEYVTALSSMGSLSAMGGERSSSVQNLLEDNSEGTKTFASFLQTVATSMDYGEEGESVSSSYKSNINDISMDMENVFEEILKAQTANNVSDVGKTSESVITSPAEETLVAGSVTDTVGGSSENKSSEVTKVTSEVTKVTTEVKSVMETATSEDKEVKSEVTSGSGVKEVTTPESETINLSVDGGKMASEGSGSDRSTAQGKNAESSTVEAGDTDSSSKAAGEGSG